MIATRNEQHDKPQDEREYPSRNPDPTHEEIREACLEIQSEWSEREFKKRAGVRPAPWTAPTVTLPQQEE